MSNPFGGFNVTSPLSSTSHNALHDLQSNCIRDFFGPTCQTVADCLLSKGTSTCTELLASIREKCKRDINSERLKLVDYLAPLSKTRSTAHLNLARGSEEKGFIVDSSAVRAALIVLVQHSLVKVVPPPRSVGTGAGAKKKMIKYKYALEHDRAIFIQRYPRYVEYARKMYQETGAALVEEILVRGRMGTVEAIKACVECVGRYLSADGDSEVSGDEKMVLAQKAAETLKAMVDDGYIELVLPIGTYAKSEDDSEHNVLSQILLLLSYQTIFL